MALRSLTIILLAVTIIPDIVVMTNLVAKPRQMMINIVYDFVEDGNATHQENPTAAPTGTVPPGTTVTAPPGTVTQTSSVTTPSGSGTTNNGEFHCTSEGTFADPKDCSKYYRCNKDLVALHDKCFFGHYDPSSNGCVFGGC